jgi:hypothetical protein
LESSKEIHTSALGLHVIFSRRSRGASPSGGAYNTIGKYIGYIRTGLASGGEDLPICTSTGSGSSTKGVWPSPQGLTYDLATYGPLGPDWFATTYPCTTDPSCQGRYAYIDGSPNGVTTDGTGYVATVFAAFQASLTRYMSANPLYKPYIMASAHSGPPQSLDSTWADDEAKIFMKWPCRNCEQSGFGDQSLNEYDLLNDTQDPCTNDWCNLFSDYTSYGGNLYLQTTIPNDFATSQISSINQTSQVVTCNQCTSQANFSGQYGGLYNGEGFAVPSALGGKYMFKIASNGVSDANHFTLDSTTVYNPNIQSINFPATLYVGDYLPDTIPFAAAHFANTIEVYFCDWEFAYNPGSASVTCQPHDPTITPVYANILSNP